MSACGSLHHAFDKPLESSTPPFDSIPSWKQNNSIKPVHDSCFSFLDMLSFESFDVEDTKHGEPKRSRIKGVDFPPPISSKNPHPRTFACMSRRWTIEASVWAACFDPVASSRSLVAYWTIFASASQNYNANRFLKLKDTNFTVVIDKKIFKMVQLQLSVVDEHYIAVMNTTDINNTYNKLGSI